MDNGKGETKNIKWTGRVLGHAFRIAKALGRVIQRSSSVAPDAGRQWRRIEVNNRLLIP